MCGYKLAGSSTGRVMHRWATPVNIPSLNIPPIKGKNARHAEFSTDFWWMIGRWLGDGSIRLRENGYSGEITICCGKAEINEMLALHFAPRQGPHAKQGELHWRQREIRTSYLFECTNEGLARWIVENFGKLAHGKTLPTWVFGMKQEWREALLNGYISSDGSRTDRYTSISSVSKQLALGIRLLVSSLGYHASFGCYRHKAGSIEGRPFEAYDMWIVRWENNKSQRTGITDGDHSWTIIKDVQPSGRSIKVYNLSVDEDESYIADGIVVHNCTNHTLAKGVSKKKQFQPDLFGDVKIDPAAERSRATMWDVPRFAEYHNYEIVIVENVVDASQWVMWPAWLQAMHLLGYDHKCIFFNSMFAHPTPQSRDRLYVVFWKKGNKAPNLEFTPAAWCAKCERNVESLQTWKKDRTKGKYKSQYVYSCPTCRKEVKPYYFAAANAIDWSIPVERIGNRKKPLKFNTLRRIQVGLEKYARPVTVDLAYSHATNDRSRPIDEALVTQTTRQTTGLAVPPFIIELYGNSNVRDLEQALSTIVTNPHHGLAVPFLTSYYGTGGATGVEQAVPTVTTKDRHSLVVPPFLMSVNHTTDRATSVHEPFNTVMTQTVPALVSPFIVSYYTRLSGQQSAVSGICEPLPTQPTWPLHYVAQPSESVNIEDCGFRMLQPHELQKAMAFPDDYILIGDGRTKVKLLGNAVTPPVMKMIVKRCVESLL